MPLAPLPSCTLHSTAPLSPTTRTVCQQIGSALEEAQKTHLGQKERDKKLRQVIEFWDPWDDM